jgi:hypothetical protein
MIQACINIFLFQQILSFYSPALKSPTVLLNRISTFDDEFAEMISKPLPEWYKEHIEEQEREEQEIQKNKDRIMEEFKKKYESKYEGYAKKSKNPNWLTSIFGTSLTKEKDYSEKTTKEKWEDFWETERKDTGFRLPGFFEVFPELKLKWPIWAKRKDGGVIKCETDQDCQFPQACCPHPILPGDKFCCTGFGKRILVPAYETRKIIAQQSQSPNSDRNPGGPTGGGLKF